MVKDLPLGEITLRKYEKPYDSSKRELIKKVCLSLGLLQPGDSRDIIVDILLILEDARLQKLWLSSFEIRDKVELLRQENSLEKKGLAESNIRRQLKRLRDSMLADKQEKVSAQVARPIQHTFSRFSAHSCLHNQSRFCPRG